MSGGGNLPDMSSGFPMETGSDVFYLIRCSEAQGRYLRKSDVMSFQPKWPFRVFIGLRKNTGDEVSIARKKSNVCCIHSLLLLGMSLSGVNH